jgi:hypothetical protein
MKELIQSAKEQAAKEAGYDDFAHAVLTASIVPLLKIIDRAIELAIEAERETLLGALPNDVTIYDKAVDAKYTATARTAYDQGARWMRTELAELLTPTDKP